MLLVVVVFSVAIVTMLAAAAAVSRGASTRWMDRLVVLAAAAPGVVLLWTVSQDDDSLVAAAFAGYALLVASMPVVTTSYVVRHLREHWADLCAPAHAAVAPPVLDRLIGDAGESGFLLVPDGVTEAAGGHGTSAILVDDEGRIAELIVDPALPDDQVQVVLTVTENECLLYTASGPVDGFDEYDFIEAVGVPGGSLRDLLAAHRSLEAGATERGERLRPVRPEDALEVVRTSDCRVFRRRVDHPWRWSFRSVRSLGPLALFGLRSAAPMI